MNVIVEKVSLFFGDKRKHCLGAIELDAVIKESHELKAQITEHPAENGEGIGGINRVLKDPCFTKDLNFRQKGFQS